MQLSIDSDKTQKILEVPEYITDHYKEPLRAEELSALMGFSPSHFRRVFKEYIGKSLNLYLQTLRIEEACKLLKNKELSVEQVALKVGYRDMKHFYSVFKKVTGKLPKAFR